MIGNNREFIRAQIMETVLRLADPLSGWAQLADVGNTLSGYGILYRDYGYEKLRPFLESFEELEFNKIADDDDKPPVYMVRLKKEYQKQTIAAVNGMSTNSRKSKSEEFTADMNLHEWAYISGEKYQTLVNMIPREDWGKTEVADTKENGEELRYFRYPKLENYISYTAKRLAYEKKILYAENTFEKVKYAAFHTGLVDKSYDWIYALFKENTRYPDSAAWYLVDFVIVGQNAGKTLNSIFKELPQRANYFENIGNVLFETDNRLSCDYEHILVERPERLPFEFILESCPEFACIDGISVEEALDYNSSSHREYYDKLSNALHYNPMVYNRMKKRLDEAISMAIKRVQWNYKTAVPMYDSNKKTCAFLLPLMLVSPDRVDVALVVTKEPSGAYQGQTVLPLPIAYANSRLIAKPDSDWLIDKNDSLA